MKATNLILFLLCFAITANSQQDTTIVSRSLDSVIIISFLNQNIIKPLPLVKGSYIFSGKKTEVIDLTTPSTESSDQNEVQVQSQNRLKSDVENPQDVEIVELPTQE